MSRSNPEVKLTNPATKFFEWSGKFGHLSYWDKELPNPDDSTKKGDNVVVKTPFTFIVLDQLATVKGYIKALKSSFFSNEIPKKNIKKDIFKVRTKQGDFCEGLWEVVKTKDKGIKFTESVYIAFMEGGKLTIGNIGMVGSSLSAWIDFCSGVKPTKENPSVKESPAHDVEKGAIVITGSFKETNGDTTYFVPIFKQKETSPETEKTVLDLDRELQVYLKKYFLSKNTSEDISEAEIEKGFDSVAKSTNLIAEPNDDIPF